MERLPLNYSDAEFWVALVCDMCDTKVRYRTVMPSVQTETHVGMQTRAWAYDVVDSQSWSFQVRTIEPCKCNEPKDPIYDDEPIARINSEEDERDEFWVHATAKALTINCPGPQCAAEVGDMCFDLRQSKESADLNGRRRNRWPHPVRVRAALDPHELFVAYQNRWI